MKNIARQIPNILTIFRFILIPFIVINLVYDSYIAAFVIFTISGLTDILDGFIARMYAKGAEKATQGATSKQRQENTEDESKENQTKDETPKKNQQSVLPSDYYQNKIGLAMAIKGINPTKLQRASRLVDQEKVIINGAVDDTKLEEEINAIISEFPELVEGANSTSEQKGFKFGAAGNQTQDATDNINDELDEIFGNK